MRTETIPSPNVPPNAIVAVSAPRVKVEGFGEHCEHWRRGMSYEIVHRYTGAALYRSNTAADVWSCVEEARSAGANLRGAHLVDADLRRTNLVGVNLAGADLRRANLADAGLAHANLRGADLAGANLVDTNLVDADLVDAHLRGADLRRTDLRRANLRRANLVGASLRDANLMGANLGGADLGNLHVLQIVGSQHWIVALLSPDGCEVRIGCKRHPLAWWLEHYRNVGEIEEYTLAQIDEYGRHLAYVEEWAKHVTPKGGAA